jgi:CheY-like chemotaxis protein
MSALDQNAFSSGQSARPKRLLVVEDESLVALMMADQVVELGYTVVGPAFSLAEARQLAASASIDGALLDLNLDGVLSHEIADIFTRRQIPFALITGYSDVPLDTFENVNVLHKPFLPVELAHVIKAVLAKPPVHRHA